MLTLLTAAVLATAPLDDEQELRGPERPAAAAGNRTGVVFGLGVIAGEADRRAEPMLGFHGRAGLRFGFLDRSEDPGRPNFGFAVLVGGDYTNLAHGFGAEARLEIGVGGNAELYQPFFNTFVSAGFQNLWFDRKPELHAGFGAGMDMLFSGLFHENFSVDLGHLHSGGAVAVGALVAFLLAPTVEVRWVVRPDGTLYKCALFSFAV